MHTPTPRRHCQCSKSDVMAKSRRLHVTLCAAFIQKLFFYHIYEEKTENKLVKEKVRAVLIFSVLARDIKIQQKLRPTKAVSLQQHVINL